MPDPLSELQRLGQEFDADGVEAVARACADDPDARLIAGKSETVCFDDMDSETQEFWRCIARAAIAAARPMIEAEAFEKAAKVADEKAKYTLTDTARHAATAIRALGDGAG